MEPEGRLVGWPCRLHLTEGGETQHPTSATPASCLFSGSGTGSSTGVEPLLLLVSLQACTPGFPGAMEGFHNPLTVSFLLQTYSSSSAAYNPAF